MKAAVATSFKLVSGEGSVAGGRESSQKEEVKKMAESTNWSTLVGSFLFLSVGMLLTTLNRVARSSELLKGKIQYQGYSIDTTF
jgi:hypothetical protein